MLSRLPAKEELEPRRPLPLGLRGESGCFELESLGGVGSQFGDEEEEGSFGNSLVLISMSPRSKALVDAPSGPKSSGGREGAESGIFTVVGRGLLLIHSSGEGDTLFGFGRPSSLLLPKGSLFMV